MLIGVAVGFMAGIAATMVVTAPVRPDVVIGLVVAVPSSIGLLLVLCSGRRWITTFGVFVLSVAPGWLSVLVAMQAVSLG